MSHSHQRRTFLRQAAALAPLASASTIGLNFSAITRAAAQSVPGSSYRALVCIYLSGGNDAFNTVLATDTSSWSAYTTQRQPHDGSPSIALMPAGTTPSPTASGSAPEKLGGVLPISHAGRAVHAGRQFAMHPALTAVQQMHQAGRVAVLANVGPLTRPTTKADWSNAAISKPPKLFSHNDQQSVWLSFKPEGSGQGWAGLMGDTLMGQNGGGHSATDTQLIQKSFTCMTPASMSVWMAGRSVVPYQTSVTQIAQLGINGTVFGSTRLQSGVAAIMGKLDGNGQTTITPHNLFAADHQAVVQRAMQAGALLGGLSPLGQGPWSTNGTTNAYVDPLLMYTSPVDGTLKFNQLALQLQMVARLMDTNRAANLGINRQFFMVNLGPFDTHSNQIADHAERLAQLNHAMAYFDGVLGNMPAGDLRSQVTTFTASEFGRTFTSNGDGTDHGWGGHHLIMGGAVIGTEVYGTFPTYSTSDINGNFSSPDQIQNGVLIPTTSVDQYAYTLGKWMGVSDSDLQAILPNLSQFNSSAYDLGFLRA